MIKLAAKITLTTGAVTLLATMSLGAGVLFASYSEGMDQLKDRLNSTVAQVENSTEDKLSTGLLVVESQEIGLSYVEADGTVTVLQEINAPDDSVVQKILGIGNEESLLFKISSQSVQNAALGSGIISALLSIFAAALATLLTWLLLKSDFMQIRKLTNSAMKIADGENVQILDKASSSELSELSAALSLMVERLQASKYEMQEFLSDASHELRTPLTVIRGYLELLQNGHDLPKDKQLNAIRRAHSESVRMQHLINDILKLAELGQLPEISSTEVDIAALVQDQVNDLITLEPNREVTFSPAKFIPVAGSAELLAQLITNIFGNIRNHTPAGSKIMVKITEANQSVEIVVEDSGPGIEGLEAGGVFTEFRRFDEARSRVTGGSGLGLSIMARIAELHGGSLRLSKGSLGGLKVTVSLPKAKAP